MVFFPDACFYEFIPEEEMRRNLRDPAYQPRTCLMDEIQTGETYELVLSVLHGGAFMRYRIGDMYHCISAGSSQLPLLTFVDRVPDVIDIAGFTRITASSCLLYTSLRIPAGGRDRQGGGLYPVRPADPDGACHVPAVKKMGFSPSLFDACLL